jgi:coproporphyrinogen III oxidase-like Fe-S oxidoreductase
MLSERMLSSVVRNMNKRYLDLKPTDEKILPRPQAGRAYMLYLHVPFCERLCPYCSFNRFPFNEARAMPYFESVRKEMCMLKDLGYDFEALYVGGGTPTIMIGELAETIELARDLFSIKDVSSETNPNHLVPEYLGQLSQIVQRLSVGVQSFDDSLLKQMDRYEKYGSAEQILERVQSVEGMFKTLNVDMIFNFPSQTEEMLHHDIEMLKQARCTQTTFYPLMASPSVERSLKATVGEVSYDREKRFYEIIDRELTGVDPVTGTAPFTHGSAWTFSSTTGGMIDEYVVDYEEYPAIGSGGLTYLDGNLYVNTFSLREYGEAIAAGHMSIMGKTSFSKRDRMRYRFMMSLFGLRLDKREWRRDFGCSVAGGLPVENAFMKMNGAYDVDDDEGITLTPKGRYLMVAMMRQFFIGVNGVRDRARAALPTDEHDLLFGDGSKVPPCVA